MKSPKENSIIDRLRQWLSGTATGHPPAELQDAAAEDPFLAEALEGYEAFPDIDHAKSLQRSRMRLRELYPEKKRRSLVWLASRVAAAAVVLVVLVWGVQNMGMENMPQHSIAMEKAASEADPSVNSETPTASESIAESSIAETEPLEEAKSEVSKPPTPPAIEEESNFTIAVEPEVIEELEAPAAIVKDYDLAQNASPKPEAYPASPPPPLEAPLKEADAPETEGYAYTPPQDDLESTVADTLAIADASPPPATFAEEAEDIAATESNRMKKRQAESAKEVRSKRMSDNSSDGAKSKTLLQQKDQPVLRTIEGKVLEEGSGEPLIGANVIVPGSNNGTTTDFDGFFRMEIPADAKQLAVNYTGYSNQLTDIDQKDYVEIQLSEGAVLSESVVIAYGREAEKEDLNRYKRAKPEKGFRKFRKYLAANLVYPPDAIQENIQGEVELSFNVSNSGQPYNIKVVRSLGYGCDQEAIRLLKEGPAWSQPLPFKEKEVTYSFSFKLK